MVKAAFIVIGNEILSGKTQDVNINYIAKRLSEKYIELTEVRIIRDITDDIIQAILALKDKYDYIFTSGGIGSTHDDITTAAIAQALQLPLERDSLVESLIREHYSYSKDNMDVILKMADFPAGYAIIPNKYNHIPSYSIKNIYVLAGYPNIMINMFDAVFPSLKSGKKKVFSSIKCFTREALLSKFLYDLQGEFPIVEIGSYPSYYPDAAVGKKYITEITFTSTDELMQHKAKTNLLEYCNKFEYSYSAE